MDLIETVFKDPTKIRSIIRGRYGVVVIGHPVRMVIDGVVGIDFDMNQRPFVGLGSQRLYFVFDNVDMPRDGSSFPCINADLDEVAAANSKNVTIPGMPWIKMRTESTTPSSATSTSRATKGSEPGSWTCASPRPGTCTPSSSAIRTSHTTTLRLTVGSRVLICKCSSQNPELFLVTDMPTNVVVHRTMTSCVL
jgi:hypothetical protein